jgi:hypothetical protein
MKYNNIWMCWFQGLKNSKIPPLNKKCIDKWIELNNRDWNINILSSSNIKDYIPEFFDILSCKTISFTKQSDLLRALLLDRYGGVWVDASVYPVLPLSNFIDIILNDTKFFAYRFLSRSIDPKKGNRDISSWFLVCDQIKHYLISRWKDSFVEKISKDECKKYYCFHETLTELFDEDSNIKNIINNMVQIDQRIPHSAMRDWHAKKESFVYKRPKLPDYLN